MYMHVCILYVYMYIYMRRSRCGVSGLLHPQKYTLAIQQKHSRTNMVPSNTLLPCHTLTATWSSESPTSSSRSTSLTPREQSLTFMLPLPDTSIWRYQTHAYGVTRHMRMQTYTNRDIHKYTCVYTHADDRNVTEAAAARPYHHKLSNPKPRL